MKRGRLAFCALLGTSFVICGCRRHSTTAPVTKALESFPGVLYQEAPIIKFPEHPRLWIYVPKDQRKIHPCLFIAAAGSPLYSGMRLTEADRAEHLPYLSAGFAVVAYDVSGAPVSTEIGESSRTAMNLFAKRDAGIANGRAAIDYALRHLKVDPLRLYSTGHSSAGTLAIQLAAMDSRIRGCVAYAPVWNVPDHLGADVLGRIREFSPAAVEAISKDSPSALIERLHCPIMVFSAKDDETVPNRSVAEFVHELSQRNVDVEFITAASGGHYDSMIREGIPAGIAWLLRSRNPVKKR